MADLPDRLKDYITVAERLEAFYARYPDGSMQSRVIELSDSRVVMEASAFRDREDPRPGIGYSSMPIPAKNVMLRDSEIETCETSAWGRAIAALGFEVRKAVASRNEIENKTPSSEPRDGDLIGLAEAAKPPHDFEVRQTPEGPAVGFALKEGREIVRVIAYGTLAEQVAAFRDGIEGQRVQCYGTMTAESWTVNKGTPKERQVPYTRLALTRLTAQGLTLPLEDTEPDTVPLGLVPEQEAELDAIAANLA